MNISDGHTTVDEEEDENTPIEKTKAFLEYQQANYDPGIFVMDAHLKGNVSRFYNHSCSPNVFVQNVFLESWDVRFPWVAFFTATHIKAGTELVWDYSYEVRSYFLTHCNRLASFRLIRWKIVYYIVVVVQMNVVIVYSSRSSFVHI